MDRLILVRRALDRGHRPSQTVPLVPEELRRLLGDDPSTTSGEAPWERWFELVTDFDGAALEREFRVESSNLGQLACIRDRLLPFLHELGERWCQGLLSVGHEHFASERIEAFLISQWKPLSDAASGPRVVLASLPEEDHVLPLHLAAWVLASSGFGIHFLGSRTPLPEFPRVVAATSSSMVVTSVSLAAEARKSRHQLENLRTMLPREVELLVGGTSLGEIEGVVYLESFEDLAIRIR